MEDQATFFAQEKKQNGFKFWLIDRKTLALAGIATFFFFLAIFLALRQQSVTIVQNLEAPKVNATQEAGFITSKLACSGIIGNTDNTRIFSVVDGKVLDFHENQDGEGKEIFIYDLDEKSIPQQWTWSSELMTFAGSAFTSIWHENGTIKVLDEENESGTLYAWDYSGGQHQFWIATHLPSGAFQIKNKLSGRCISALGDHEAKCVECSIDDKRQHWCFAIPF